MTEIEYDWIQAGFFLITGGKAPERERSLLPETLVTVSTCIVESYPDSWALPWVETPPETLRGLRESLGLTEPDFADLRSWVRRAMDDGDYGWPNVFFSLRAAREFRDRFLGAVAMTRLVGLSLARDVAGQFTRDEAPQAGRDGSGVWAVLARGEPLSPGMARLGFDVLGAEYGGSFHTFSCNDLARDYSEKLGLTFNQHGLIDDYREAVAACAYTNRHDTGAEPVAWYPFRLDEYRANEAG